jgi:hypothetical protein
MKKISIFLSFIWIFALGLGANPLDLQKVPKDANWFAHFDFSAMRKSEVGTFIRTSIEEIPEVMNRINRMKKDHGIDLDGFSHLTLSGSGERDRAIAILKGGVDMKKIFENPKLVDRLEMDQIGKNKIYSTNRGRQPMAFAPLKKGVIVGGPNINYVNEGILLAKGKSPSHPGNNLLDSLIASVDHPGFLVFADIERADKENYLDERARFMSDKIKTGAMVIGEAGGAIRISAVLEATGEETSAPLEAMIQGGMAMIDMKKNSDTRLDAVLERHSVRRVGNLIWMEMDLSVDAIMEHIKKEMNKSA